MLTAMGIEAEKIDQIIEAHGETVDALKKEAEAVKEQAGRVPALEKEIEDMKAAQPTEDWEAKYNALKAESDSYRAQVAQEKADAEKASMYRAMLRDLGIAEKRIDAIMKVADLGGVSVENGAIAGAEELSRNLAEEWAEFIPQVTTQGANVPTPPQTDQTAGANPDVVARLQARHERLYGAETQTE